MIVGMKDLLSTADVETRDSDFVRKHIQGILEVAQDLHGYGKPIKSDARHQMARQLRLNHAALRGYFLGQLNPRKDAE